MAELDLATEQARVAELHGQADEVMTRLRGQLAAVRAAQQEALSATGEATSRDGSVRVVVDSTGVVTSLEFAPSAFERNTPPKLAQATVAAIQAAAAAARAKVAASLAPVREPGVLAAAAAGVPGLAGLAVPAVPRTATDPAAETEPRPAADRRNDDDSSMFGETAW